MKTLLATEFRKNPALEQRLAELTELLSACQEKVNQEYVKPRFPVLLIMGVPRSGTTLFLQWLAASERWGYPSNTISRFYGAPYIGARVQQILFEHDYLNEITAYQQTASSTYSSSHGKTKGPAAPHEFWYFWRRFFTFDQDSNAVPPQALEHVDVARLNAELATLEAALDKPLAMKAMLLNWNIPFLDAAFEKVLFVHVKRDPIYVMQSILEKRREFGSEDSWYGFKPPEYRWLVKLDPVTQVAGQVHFTQRALEDGLAQVADSRKMTVGYEQFCREPAVIWKMLQSTVAAQGCSIEGPYSGPDHFEATNVARVSPERWVDFGNALKAIRQNGP